MVALVDGDVLMYRSCFGSKGDFIQTVELLEYYLQSIGENVGSTKLVLSGSTNFRKEIDANYKSSRKDKPKPRYFYDLRDYAVSELGAEVTDGIEADDQLGILQSDDTCLCSNDKDFLQVPGYHYRLKKNWSENELIYVDEDTAWFNFFQQILTGDSVDDVKGLTGIGPVKATKALLGKTKEEMLVTTQEMYKREFGDDWFSAFDRTARLIFIRRNNATEYYQLI